MSSMPGKGLHLTPTLTHFVTLGRLLFFLTLISSSMGGAELYLGEQRDETCLITCNNCLDCCVKNSS